MSFRGAVTEFSRTFSFRVEDLAFSGVIACVACPWKSKKNSGQMSWAMSPGFKPVRGHGLHCIDEQVGIPNYSSYVIIDKKKSSCRGNNLLRGTLDI